MCAICRFVIRSQRSEPEDLRVFNLNQFSTALDAKKDLEQIQRKVFHSIKPDVSLP